MAETTPAQKSQAQTVLENAGQKAKTPEKAAATGTPGGVGEEAQTQFFEGTIVKVDEDGNEVMSDHLLPGERLRRHGDEAKDTSTD